MREAIKQPNWQDLDLKKRWGGEKDGKNHQDLQSGDVASQNRTHEKISSQSAVSRGSEKQFLPGFTSPSAT